MIPEKRLRLMQGSLSGTTEKVSEPEVMRPPLVLHEDEAPKPRGKFRRMLGSLVARNSAPDQPQQLELVKSVRKDLIMQTRGQALYTFAHRRNESEPDFQNHTRNLTYRVRSNESPIVREVTIATAEEKGIDVLKSMRISRILEGSQLPELNCKIEFDGDNQPIVMVPDEHGSLVPSRDPSNEVSLAFELAERGAAD